VPSSTICMSWLVPNRFKLSFRTLLDYLTDALADRAEKGFAGTRPRPGQVRRESG
jgi:hypothetical protein